MPNIASKKVDNSVQVRQDVHISMIDKEISDEQMRCVLRMFGKTELRVGQREIITAALSGRNVLGVLPTGHGKSLCYQASAVLLGGTSVVVSPLIALMRDQVQSLQRVGIAAERFDSTLTPEQRVALMQQLSQGRICLLFVAPESLENEELQGVLKGLQRTLFVVDESHCVSEWGHSFRPDYLKLPDLFRKMRFRSLMALTATATQHVQQDLCTLFNIAATDVYSLSPYRANIRRDVCSVSDRLQYMAEVLRNGQHRPAIVYTRTRKGTEEVAAALQQMGFAAVGYHAGMPAETRENLQDDFFHNRKDVLVATIAFGMGIDKPDIRSVIHYDEPTSPEAYLQESGRGGRDGNNTLSLVFVSEAGQIDARNRIYAAEPDYEGVQRAVRWLMPKGARAVSLWELCTTCDVPEDVAMRALIMLEREESVKIEARGYKYYKVKPLFTLGTITDGRCEEEAERLRWLHDNREGEVEDAAAAWNCSYSAAMEQLRECEVSGEWKLTFRQQALYVRTVGTADAAAVAAELSESYKRRRENDLQRFETLRNMLCKESCINAALESYFCGKRMMPCGHCSACSGKHPALLPAEYTYEPLSEHELPEFFRDSQRKRFLLGLASPGLNARRLWAHALYGSAAGTPWHEL